MSVQNLRWTYAGWHCEEQMGCYRLKDLTFTKYITCFRDKSFHWIFLRYVKKYLENLYLYFSFCTPWAVNILRGHGVAFYYIFTLQLRRHISFRWHQSVNFFALCHLFPLFCISFCRLIVALAVRPIQRQKLASFCWLAGLKHAKLGLHKNNKKKGQSQFCLWNDSCSRKAIKIRHECIPSGTLNWAGILASYRCVQYHIKFIRIHCRYQFIYIKRLRF